MSNSRSHKKPAQTPARKSKALPLVNIPVTGTVWRILQSKDQPVHAALLSFTTQDVLGERNSFIGMLRRADIIGSNEYSPTGVDLMSQARLNSLKLGDTLSVMTVSAYVRQGDPRVLLSERAMLESVVQLLVGTRMSGTVLGKHGDSLVIDLDCGIKGLLPKTSTTADGQPARLEDYALNQSVSVRVLSVELHPDTVGQFYLHLAEVTPELLAA
jgi:hypothetical protein